MENGNSYPYTISSFSQKFSELKKISGTSDFSKLFESILKDFILNDIASNLPAQQFGGRGKVGTEHLINTFTDKVLKMLEYWIVQERGQLS